MNDLLTNVCIFLLVILFTLLVALLLAGICGINTRIEEHEKSKRRKEQQNQATKEISLGNTKEW